MKGKKIVCTGVILDSTTGQAVSCGFNVNTFPYFGVVLNQHGNIQKNIYYNNASQELKQQVLVKFFEYLNKYRLTAYD